MNEPTLTDTERVSLLGGIYDDDESATATGYAHTLAAAARIKAEAVDRERAAWATKIETLADDYAASSSPHLIDASLMVDDLRSLLAADDTEGKR